MPGAAPPTVQSCARNGTYLPFVKTSPKVSLAFPDSKGYGFPPTVPSACALLGRMCVSRLNGTFFSKAVEGHRIGDSKSYE